VSAPTRRLRAARDAVSRSWIVRRLKKVIWDWHRRRRGWLVASLGPARLRLPCDDRLGELIYFWDFERQERDVLEGLLRPGDVFVDVGANLGLFTVIAGLRVGHKGRVFAFEPSLRSYRRLQDNVLLNRLDNARCLAVALSDRAGELVLKESADGFDAWNSMGTPTRGGLYNESSVKSMRWDEFATHEGLYDRVTMMKIDVEGWENRVLVGGREFFSREKAPLLQVEFCDAAAEATGSSCAALYQTLSELGYRVARLDRAAGLVPDDLRPSYSYENLYATKDLAWANARLSEAS